MMEQQIFLLGHPVAHSLSPAMHHAALRALGMNSHYLLLDVSPEHLGSAMGVLRASNVLGCNLTIPHKQAAIQWVDRLTPIAQSMGAINTVYKENGLLIGTNTDGPGFIRALRQDGGIEPRGACAALVGAGGAAMGCGWALLDAGLKRMIILNRTASRALELAARLQHQFPSAEVSAAEMTSGHIQQAAAEADLLVNATSVGMGEAASVWPDSQSLPKHLFICDLVYRPLATKLLTQAQSAGLRSLGGLSMLLYQGAEALQYWTGQEPPVEVMRQALLEQV